MKIRQAFGDQFEMKLNDSEKCVECPPLLLSVMLQLMVLLVLGARWQPSADRGYQMAAEPRALS